MSSSLAIGGPGPDTKGAERPLAPAAIAVGFTVLCLSWMLNATDRQVFYPLLPEIRKFLQLALEADTGYHLARLSNQMTCP